MTVRWCKTTTYRIKERKYVNEQLKNFLISYWVHSKHDEDKEFYWMKKSEKGKMIVMKVGQKAVIMEPFIC